MDRKEGKGHRGESVEKEGLKDLEVLDDPELVVNLDLEVSDHDPLEVLDRNHLEVLE